MTTTEGYQILSTNRFQCKGCDLIGEPHNEMADAASEGEYHKVSCVPKNPFMQSEDGSEITEDSIQKRKLEYIPGIGYLNWMYAGKCYVTFVNTKVNERFTYCIKKAPPNSNYQVQAHWVSVLTGPNNTNDYSVMGTIFRGTDGSVDRYVHNHRRGTIDEDAPSVVAFKYVFNQLVTDSLADFIELWHEGRCSMCGHLLTDPDSIRRGIGPVCINRMFA